MSGIYISTKKVRSFKKEEDKNIMKKLPSAYLSFIVRALLVFNRDIKHKLQSYRNFNKLIRGVTYAVRIETTNTIKHNQKLQTSA